MRTLLMALPLLAAMTLAACGDDTGPEDLYYPVDRSVAPVHDLAQAGDSAVPTDAAEPVDSK